MQQMERELSSKNNRQAKKRRSPDSSEKGEESHISHGYMFLGADKTNISILSC
jgi:hypothetical protein